MRILSPNNFILYSVLFNMLSFYSYSQNSKTVGDVEQKIDVLLNEKRKYNPAIILNDCYKIQIFSGEIEKAKKTVQIFKQEYKDIDATIVFNTPNYKVWVGNFKSRIEAERNLAIIQKKYKNTLLIKPSKQ